MYNKLFTKILDSSIWMEPMPTRIVWLTFIAAMDEQGFCQFASVANVAHRARVSPQEASDAIACLEAPDTNSSDPEHDGRRLERVSGGWVVLNAEKYRQLVTRTVIQAQTRERVKRFRERAKRTSNATVTPSEAIAVAVADTEARATTTTKSASSVGGGGLVMSPIQYAKLREKNRYVGARLRVPNVLHDELTAKLGGDDPDAKLTAWYATLDAEVEAAKTPIPDVFVWLRPKFVEWATVGADDAVLAQMMREAAELDAADAAKKAARRG